MKFRGSTPSVGKCIFIDDDQRVTALMATLLGHEVLTKDYETGRIRIAFNPQEERPDRQRTRRRPLVVV
jgi:hypothetical protein